jgi:hypothetical protein
MINVTIMTRSSRPPASPGSCLGTSLDRRSAGLLLIALAMSLGFADSCRAAGLVIQAPNLTVALGSSGSFDMLLIDTDPIGSPAYSVAGDSLELTLTGSAGIAFTNVTINTIVPYIYAVSATTLPGSDPLNFGITFPNTSFSVSDSDGGSPFFQTVNPGDKFGLANVSYTVSPTFSGTDTISSLGIGTSLSDTNGNPIAVTSMDGSISTVIPEPSTLIQAATALLIGLGAVWRRRRHP